jgi:hypothetical protein
VIIYEANGWRDLTDEGPGFEINSEKEDYSITQARGKPIYVTGPGLKANCQLSKNTTITLGQFMSKEDAKLFVEARLRKYGPPEENDVKFLLEQIKLDSRWQDIKSILSLMEKYK